MMAFTTIRLEMKENWNLFYKQQAELIGSIANPDAFKAYAEYHEKLNEQKDSKSKEITVGSMTHSITDSHYDPNKGLIDGEGNIIIDKNKFEKMMGIDGVALSY